MATLLSIDDLLNAGEGDGEAAPESSLLSIDDLIGESAASAEPVEPASVADREDTGETPHSRMRETVRGYTPEENRLSLPSAPVFDLKSALEQDDREDLGVDRPTGQLGPALTDALEPPATPPNTMTREQRWEELPHLGVGETAGLIGQELVDAALYHLPAAAAAAVEGPDPYAERNFLDRLIERSRARTQANAKGMEGRPERTAITGVTTQDVSSLGPSLGFSAVGAGTGLAVGVPTAAIGSPALGYIAGGSASGVAAYRMSTNQFVRDLRDAADEASMKATGQPMTDADFEAKIAPLAPLIREYGLWEAVPEAAGNVIGLGILTAGAKTAIGRAFGSHVLTRLTSKMASLYGEELATETVTQQGQHNVEAATGVSGGKQRSWSSPADIAESFKEVAPTVLLQTTLMAGAGKGGIVVHDRLRGRTTLPDESQPRPGDEAHLRPGDAESPIDTSTLAAGRRIVDEATGEAPRTDIPEGAVPAESIIGEAPEDVTAPEVAPGESTPIGEPAAVGQEAPPAVSPAPPIEGTGERDKPVVGDTAAAVDIAGQQANPEPTEGQKEAGNYKKAHIQYKGFDITIENPRGSTRTGTDSDGETWSVQMQAAYGYIKRTVGGDGENVDVYIGLDDNSDRAFVVDQIDPKTGKFDEHKAILGATNLDDAEFVYDAHFNDGSGPARRGAVTEMSLDEFREWVNSNDARKPVAYAQEGGQQAQETETAPETPGTPIRATAPPASPANEALNDTQGRKPVGGALVQGQEPGQAQIQEGGGEAAETGGILQAPQGTGPSEAVEDIGAALSAARKYVSGKSGGKVTILGLKKRFDLTPQQARRVHEKLRAEGELTARGYVHARRKAPQDVLGVIREMGGIQPDGDIRAMDLQKGRPGLVVGKDKGGSTVADVRERLEELGMVESGTHDSVVYDQIREALAGRPTATNPAEADLGVEEETRRVEEENARQIEAAVEAVGVDLTADEMEAAKKLVADGLDPDTAVERVVMENVGEVAAEDVETDPDMGDIPFEVSDENVQPAIGEVAAQGQPEPEAAEGTAPEERTGGAEPRRGAETQGEEGGVEPTTDGSPAYEAAYQEFNAASRKYNQAKEDYQARKIGDDEFVAARKAFDAASAKFDKVEAAEQAGENVTTEQTDQGAQYVIPGTEGTAQQAQDARDQQGGLRATTDQKPADEGLFAPPAEGEQTDIEQRAEFQIGENAKGQPVFEDENGVRSISENGIRISEAVGVRPTRGGYEAEVPSKHEDRFLTPLELADARNPGLFEKMLAKRDPALPRIETLEDAVRLYQQNLETMRDTPTTVGIMDTPERMARQKEIADKLYDNGGFRDPKKNLRERPRHDRRIDIVIGPPAAGKSSNAVDPLLKAYQGVMIDADEAKEELPEFNNGMGANAVHAESAEIAENFMVNRALDAADNIVHPILGKNLQKLQKILYSMREEGYAPYLTFVDLPIEKAIDRSIFRWVETGRLIPPSLFRDIGDNPAKAYEALKGQFDGYRKISTDVPFGERPRIIEDSADLGSEQGLGGRRGGQVNQNAGRPGGQEEATQGVAEEPTDDGIRNNVPSGNEGEGAESLQPADEVGGDGGARQGEVGGGTPVVRPTGEGQAQAGQRPGGEPVGPEGNREPGVGAVSGVPAGRPAGRTDTGETAGAVKGENFVVEPGSLKEDRGPTTKARDNIRAIELVHQIEAEGRPATAAEQADLARYVGWGGLSGAFPDTQGNFGKGLEAVGAKLRDLLNDNEYRTARRSIQYAHYTSETVVRSMWQAAQRLGFKGGKIFEPGMGIGNFAGMMPGDLAAVSDYNGLELDHMTVRIARLLYPKYGVRLDDFTKAPLPKDTFDVAIGNPPFADIAIKSDPAYKQDFLLHDYFFAKSLDSVRPGGLLAFISSAGTLNKEDATAREYMADRADFLGAIRLPGNAFARNAGTEVTTDIIMLRKRLPGETPGSREWTETVQVTLPNAEGGQTKGRVNKWIANNPDAVLGEQGFFDKLYKGRYAVRAPKGFDLAAAIAERIDALPQNVMSEWQDVTERAQIDFGTAERKEGAFYFDKDGQLMQFREGVGRPVERRGKGVKGGKSFAEMERIKGLIPIRDALRAVYASDLSDDTENAALARTRLNKAYDAFVEKFGPINKADIQSRRPSIVQQEGYRAAAREEARFNGQPWDEGSFDATEMLMAGATLQQAATARRKAQEEAAARGETWDEGSFDPDATPDVIIDKRPNIDPFMDDQEGYRLRAIEKYIIETGEAKKTAIFKKNIITREAAPQINSVNDAVLFVLNKVGRLDVGEVARAAGVTESEAIEQLGEKIFLQPGTLDTWLSRDEYLSGNVRKKLRQAKTAAERNPDFQRNVDALESVQPTPLAPSDIIANLGMPWIPTETIEKFGTEGLGLESLTVDYTPALATWTVRGDTASAAANSVWGTDDMAAPALIQSALNRQTPRVTRTYREAGQTRTEVDPVATEAAQEKVLQIKNRFNDWLWEDQARAQEHADIYNEDYNNLVTREFNGDYLTTPGIASFWKWRPHQSRVIARIIQHGNTYMAHGVGAGKTSAMIGAGMEMRRLGLVRKPMYAVPRHMLGQFTQEFYEQYPTARIAVADEKRFHTSRRKQFVADVATSDLDAIIITHPAFGLIPISADFQDNLIGEQIDNYREVLSEIENDQENRITRKRLENAIERLEQRLSGRGNARKDQVMTFEEMGVDFLFVDEAHEFRKLDFATRMSSVKGISPEGSQAAWDLYVKTRYLETINPGRNLVLASGTPVTNTMAELFTISRYIQQHELNERGLAQFDAWAGAFGDTVSITEQDPAGGYKIATRFAKFVNVPELSAMVRQNMDVVTSKQLEAFITRPALKGGKRQMNLAEKSPELESYQRSLAARMDAIQRRRGPPEPGDDILLTVIGDGRKAAIDMRLVDKNNPNNPGSKLNLLIDNVYRIWKETKRVPFYESDAKGFADKPFDYGPATQMVFANLGVTANAEFNTHKNIAAELARRGVPKKEIVLISEHNTMVARQRVFNDMNAGKVRVLIGSTERMGTGVNAQDRLYANHNLDPLWFPSADEQRNGRIFRQGNKNREIEIHDYSTKGTYDAAMWGMMENKARFIEGFFRGDPTMRDMEDLGEASQYEQAKAITTADPRLIELTNLKQELEKAYRRKAAFDREQYAIHDRLQRAQAAVKRLTARRPFIEQDIETRQDVSGDNFHARANGRRFDDRVEFGESLLGQIDNFIEGDKQVKEEKIGAIAGFDILADTRKHKKMLADRSWVEEWDRDVYLRRANGFESDVKVSGSARGLVQSIEGVLGRFEQEIENIDEGIAEAKKTIEDFAPQANKTFQGNAEIQQLERQVDEIETSLTATAPDPLLAQGPISPSEIDETGTATGVRRPGRVDTKPRFSRSIITPGLARNIDQIGKDLRERLAQVGISDVVSVKLVDDLKDISEDASYTINGRYTPAQQLIEISLAKGVNQKWTMNHEIVHVLKDYGLFTTSEWSAMLKAARAQKAEMRRETKLRADEDLTEEEVAEEVIANMYADWANERSQVGGFVRHAFEKITRLLQAIADVFRNRGYNEIDDIFSRIESGEVGRRDSIVSEPGGERFSIQPEEADTPEGRQSAFSRLLSEGRPIDRVFRLPFDIFGAVTPDGRWSHGGQLSEGAARIIKEAKFKPEGHFAWMNSFLHAARAGLIDRYGLEDEYVERERARGRDERRIMLEGAEVLKSLKDQNITVEEAQILQSVLTGEEVEPSRWDAIAVPIRQVIDQLGQEAVSLGMVSRESFERNRGTYLHRVYLKHEAEENGLSRWVNSAMGRNRKKIIGNQMKGRGMFLDVPGERILRDQPGYPEAERGALTRGEKFTILDVVDETADLPGMDGREPRTTRRIFWPADQEIPDRLAGLRNRGVWEVRSIMGKKVTLWRDFTKAERTQMGEILDARYTIGKTFMLMAHDLATGRFYKDVAENEAWSSTQPPAGEWVDAAEYSRRWSDDSIEWVRVPDTDIPKTGGKKRWGALAGKYVRAEIWRDINEVEILQRSNIWQKLLTQWKLNKTARSPVVHMNNIMSNFMLMDMADIGMRDFTRGLRAYVRGTADYREAADNGAFGADMISQEVRRNVLEPLLKELQTAQQGGQGAIQGRFGLLGKLADRLWSAGMIADKGMIDLYRLEDEVFRMATYMRRRSLGDTPAVAAATAREQFLDYDIRAPWVNTARRSLLPFISYTYRAVPVIARSLAEHPWKIAKYSALAYGASALAYLLAPGDEDEERRLMREQESGVTWIGTPRMQRMPWRDDQGNPVFLDIRRWIPAGDVFDVGQGSSSFPVPAPLHFGGPLMMATELMLNRSAFTGQDITNDYTDTGRDKAEKIGDYLWKSWMPSAAWIPNSWYWEKIGLALKGAKDRAGQPVSLPQAVASSVGIKIKPQDIVQNAARWGHEFNRVERDLRFEARRLESDRQRGAISQGSFDQRWDRLLQKFETLGENERERLTPGR